jgi:aspartyl-tRNA(Asn)/glutamyl-tRNA(Gln) amidotransferase subunit A
MINILGFTIKEAHRGLEEKKFSARELTNEFIKKIESDDENIGAYLSVNKERALKEAYDADELISKNKEFCLLTGIPLAIKDNILCQGEKATAGSQILKDYIAPYDATSIRKLKSDNAVIIGKTNMDEFAMGSSTENSGYKTTRNPYDPTRVPGGSSGGSAAAVAADMAVAALGSDTGGSIRQPAAFCGLVGLKPTYGAVSRFGLIAMASSLDQIGPITKTVEDAAIIFKTIAGRDKFDSTSFEPPRKIEYTEKLFSPDLEEIKNLTVGIPEEYFIEGLSKEVRETLEETKKSLEKFGIKFKEISLPHTKYALSVYYIVMPAEASTNLARFEGMRYGTRESKSNLIETYFENRGKGFGEEVKRRIILGTFVLSAGYYDAYYNKAQRVRALIKRDFEEAFKKVDVIFTPTTPTPPFKIGEKTIDPIEMYLSDVFTIPANLAGLPAISIPSKENRCELPIGFQLIGKHWHEADILGIGQIYEG